MQNRPRIMKLDDPDEGGVVYVDLVRFYETKLWEVKMTKVYIAGKISAYGSEMLNNMTAFYHMEDKLRRNGFAPFNPASDFLVGIMFGDYSYDMYFKPNLAWIEAADCIIMLDGWETSAGALREHQIAKDLGKRIFLSYDKLVDWEKKLTGSGA